MTSQGNRDDDPVQPTVYQIRLRGHLGSQWAGWFDGLIVTLTDDGETLLSGPVADQAALHGLLRKVRDLGLTLLAVQSIPAEVTAVLPDEGAATQPQREREHEDRNQNDTDVGARLSPSICDVL